MVERVKTSENPSFAATNENRIICRVCQKQFSQYTCPRCNCRYCSLQCYKRHSLRCTESFTRENVVEELRQMQPEDETKRKMLDILKRFHSEEDMDCIDEDDIMLSEETIQKVLSGNQVNLEDLSPEEMKQFQRAVASGELSKLIEPWNPWWLMPSARTISLSQEGTQLVRSADNEQQMDISQQVSTEGHLSEIPPGPTTPLSRVSELIRSEPSPLLTVHLVDVLFSYCFTLRLYNGDWQSDPLGAAMVALDISSVLGQDGKPETVAEALACCMERTCSPTYRHAGGLQFGWGLIDDVITLLSLGGAALICALCELQRLLQAGERELKSERRKAKKGEMSKLRLADRKVYFLMCWVHEQPAEEWSSLSAIVGAERASVAVLEPVKIVGKEECKGKGLIEEIE
ncbi:uncharacterized protein LOC131232941 [Magnolia sinica]|uniref:uncharacterized protein LOC131232941 n=1 Tax=Magnolia sinica TaxID=86752 RepID=UPI002659F5A9|nr:uncharacterized protein LOC131232941 [Magnolia sinica]